MDKKVNVEVVIENLDNTRVLVAQGTSLSEIAKKYMRPGECPILGALVNHRVEFLGYRVYNPKIVKFIDIRHKQGMKMYQHSMCLMLYKAVKDTYPEATLSIDHSLSNGFYCTIKDIEGVDQETIAKTVKARMLELQKADMPFESKTMLVDDAIELLKDQNLPKTVNMLKQVTELYVELHCLGGTWHKMASKLVPSTGCLMNWDFRTFDIGYLLQWPDRECPTKVSPFQNTPKLFNIFQEHLHWVDLLHVPTIADLNRTVRDNKAVQLIHVSEALHEKKYAEIAEMIYKRKDSVRLVLLAGPSSSGKTTSCRRLCVQLNVLGFDVQQISVDDYFVDRSRTPRQPNGDYDFEALEAIDLPLLNDHLKRLFKGERVEIPTYDFKVGKQRFLGKTIQLKPSSILIVEGIHALNPKMTAEIDDGLKFKVYVSAMTQISIDDQNLIHTSDNRLIRRMVRDNNFRGWNALETLKRWDSVQQGERLHIFPYQENADVMFNSALLYELGVLKLYAEPQLKQVPQNCQEYAEAQRLLSFIELIEPISPEFIPPTSIMREFLGGSSFEY